MDIASAIVFTKSAAKPLGQLFKKVGGKISVVVMIIGQNLRNLDKLRNSLPKFVLNNAMSTNGSHTMFAFHGPYQDALSFQMGFELVVMAEDNKGSENDEYGLATPLIDDSFGRNPHEPSVVVKVAVRFVQEDLGNNRMTVCVEIGKFFFKIDVAVVYRGRKIVQNVVSVALSVMKFKRYEVSL